MRSKRFAVSALESFGRPSFFARHGGVCPTPFKGTLSVQKTFGGTTLKALRQAQDKLRLLSVNGKKLRRPCLDRFAVFAKASRNSVEKSRQAACNAACLYDCAGEICKPRSGVKSSAPHPLLYAQNASL